MSPSERFGCTGRTTVAEVAEGGNVPGVGELLLGHGSQHRRHDQRRRDAVPLDEIERRSSVERRQDHLVTGAPHRGQHCHRPRGVEQRCGDEPCRFGRERPVHAEVEGVRDQVAVREHHALRRSRRSAGVEETGKRHLVDGVRKVDRDGVGQHRS